MVKRLFFSLVMVLLLVQLISAVDTSITVKTLPEHRVMISALKPSQTYSLIESFHKDSGVEGEVSVTLSSEVQSFNLAVWVKKDGVVIISNKSKEEFSAGTPVVLEVYPDWYAPKKEESNETLNETIENITINETEPVISTEEIEEDNPKMIGAVIFGEDGFLSKRTIYYIMGIAVLLAGAIFLVTRRHNGLNGINVKKLSEFEADKKEKIRDKKEIIEEAERKIKEAQEDIKKIKDEERIDEIKKKIIEDEKELMRLRKERE